jgi:hypothetical protein
MKKKVGAWFGRNYGWFCWVTVGICIGKLFRLDGWDVFWMTVGMNALLIFVAWLVYDN